MSRLLAWRAETNPQNAWCQRILSLHSCYRTKVSFCINSWISDCILAKSRLAYRTTKLSNLHSEAYSCTIQKMIQLLYRQPNINTLFEKVLHLKPVHSWSVPGQAGHRVGYYRNLGVYGRCFAVHIAHSRAHLSYLLPALSIATPSPVYATVNKGDKNMTLASNSNFLIIKQASNGNRRKRLRNKDNALPLNQSYRKVWRSLETFWDPRTGFPKETYWPPSTCAPL